MRGRQPYEWAGMPSSTSPDLVVARLDALLGRFALSGPPSSLAHAASRVLEASSDTREPVLVDVLRTLGLRVTPVRTSAKALTASAIHGVLFTVAGGEGLLVEPMGGRARVVPLEAVGVAHLDATALAKRLGLKRVPQPGSGTAKQVFRGSVEGIGLELEWARSVSAVGGKASVGYMILLQRT